MSIQNHPALGTLLRLLVKYYQKHCISPSFKDTNWEKIIQHYLLLDKVAPSAIFSLNRAVAVAQNQGPESGLRVLRESKPPSWLLKSYIWSAVKSDLHRRSNRPVKANIYAKKALKLAPTNAIKKLLSKRFKLQ